MTTPVSIRERGLVVAEVFGPTVQGEGPSTGQRAMFVRTGRCNLDCSWCDTPYTWDWTRFDPKVETRRMSIEEVVADLASKWGPFPPPLVVITGGEPMLQASAVGDLAATLVDDGFRVEIETNGTRAPDVWLTTVARFNVSPKLPHSGVARERAIVPEVLVTYSALAQVGSATFKFVVQDYGDLDLVDLLVDEYAIVRDAVWIMPEGRTAAGIGQTAVELVDVVVRRGYNLSGRMHVDLWGDERGH